VTDDVLARRATSFGVGVDDYVRGRPGYPPEAIAWCLPKGARRVLDLAAGTGAVARVLLDLSVDVVAGSFDAVLVGQAFHWFRRDDAVAEIARVLRPGGVVGLLWNLLDDRVDWVAEVAARRVEHLQSSGVDALRANVASRSTVLLMPPEQRESVLQRVAELARGQQFDVPYVCQAWRAVRR
jgi:hypothetical protein